MVRLKAGHCVLSCWFGSSRTLRTERDDLGCTYCPASAGPSRAKRESHERIVGAGSRGYDDELASRARPVGHRVRGIRVGQLGAPDFATGPRLERIQVAVAPADEHE